MVTVAGPAPSDLFESGVDVSADGELPGGLVLAGSC